MKSSLFALLLWAVGGVLITSFLLPTVTAISTDGLNNSFTFNTGKYSGNKEYSSVEGSHSNASWNDGGGADSPTRVSSGKLNEAVQLATAQTEGMFNNWTAWTANDDWSFSFWMKSNHTSAYEGLYGNTPTIGTDSYFNLQRTNTDTLRLLAYDGNQPCVIDDNTVEIPENTWFMVTVVANNSGITDRIKIHLNDSDAIIGGEACPSLSGAWLSNEDWALGMRYVIDADSYDSWAQAQFDALTLYDYALTTENISDLWNSGSGTELTVGAPATSYFQITAYNNYTFASIEHFSANISNMWFHTSNGTIITNISTSQVHNLTVNASNYFKRLTLNHDTVSNLNTSLYQAVLAVNATQKYTGAKINSFSAYTTNSSASTTNGTAYLYLSTGVHAVTINSSEYFSGVNNSVSLSGETEYNQSFVNMTNVLLKVNATYIVNGSPILPFNATIYNTTININLTVETTNGTAYFWVINDTYNVSINASGYQWGSTSKDAVTKYDNVTFNLFKARTINLSFYNEQNYSQILSGYTISADLLLGTANATNHSTATGSIFLEELTTGDYEIRYSSTGWLGRTYFFTVTNSSYQAVRLYMLNASIGDNITNVLYDQNYNKLEGYYIKLMRFFVEENAYVMVDMGVTNFEGETVLSAEMYEPYYRYRLIDTDATTVLRTTGGTQIYDTTVNHFINTGASIGGELDQFGDIAYNFSFLTSTNQFKFDFDNPTGSVVNATLKVYKRSATGSTLLNTTVISASSGTLYGGLTAENETTYEGKAYVHWTDDGEKHVATEFYTVGTVTQVFGNYGLFLAIIIIIALVIGGIVVGGAYGIIAIPIGLLIINFAHLANIGYGIISLFFVVSIVIIYVIERRGQ